MTRTRTTRAAAALAALVLLAACAANQTANLSPEGKKAYTAGQIVIRINELQAAAIQAEAGGALPTETTRMIVQFAVSADRTLAQVPAGWPATVATAWLQLKRQLPVITNPAVLAALAAVDVVLEVYTGGAL